MANTIPGLAGGGGTTPTIGTKDWVYGQGLVTIAGPITKPYFQNFGTIGSYKFYICDTNGSRDIFKFSDVGYKIEITLTAREYLLNKQSTTNGFIQIEIGLGNLPIIKKTLKVTPFDDLIVLPFFYQVTDFGKLKANSQNFWIKKIGAGTLKIVDSKVTYARFKYDTTLNNSLYYQNTFASFSIPTKNENGRDIQLYWGNKNGETSSIKFGNGVFKSGVWKTGVWNDGWRAIRQNETDDLLYFDSINLNTYQVSPNQWFLKIDSNTNTDNVINIFNRLFVNDYVTLGNVVGIDINEERYLLKDFYRITEIVYENDTATITLDIPVAKFPLRRFEKDSSYHLIYVTKNIWLGGTFLNGYFRGIWNYGLFKGYPFTTVMDHSHFVDGKFDGGRFISTTTGLTNNNGDFIQYQTGLVQFMEFYDNNISETEGTGGYIDNTYQSWMDLNYYTQSFVNLNSLTSIYDQNFGKKVPLPNLYGYPTRDVLSSLSKFKNTTDADIDYYSLGTKYKVFTDHLGQYGYFTKAFNSEGRPGLDEFISQGWTANQGNFFGTPTVSFVYNSNITRRNFNRFTVVMATFGYNVLNNKNIVVDDKRYTVVEYDLEYFNRGFDRVTNQQTNSFNRPLNLLGSNYNSINNEYKPGIVKTEYFYNKNALDLVLRYNSKYLPPQQQLGLFGYNVTYSTNPPTGESSLSYSTTYSILMPATSSEYFQQNGILPWDELLTYNKGDIVRTPDGGSDALGYFWISLHDGNTGYPVAGPDWRQTFVAFNNLYFENTILEQSNNFSFYTSFRTSYFKFLEIDSLPFFKYFDFEVNFVDTSNSNGFLTLEFTKPHGFKVGDYVSIKLDETQFNPGYETFSTVTSFIDGRNSDNFDTQYQVILDMPYGNTPSYTNESGTLFKSGDRIDKRIQTNYFAVAPKITGLDENFVYLGNNQVFVDRDSF